MEQIVGGAAQSFYASAFSDAERLDYELAIDVAGLEGEIALMRVVTKSLVQKEPDNTALIMRAFGHLQRMVSTQVRVVRNDKAFEDAATTVFKYLGRSPGTSQAALKRTGVTG